VNSSSHSKPAVSSVAAQQHFQEATANIQQCSLPLPLPSHPLSIVYLTIANLGDKSTKLKNI
jgi:copper(I)-binding protein